MFIITPYARARLLEKERGVGSRSQAPACCSHAAALPPRPQPGTVSAAQASYSHVRTAHTHPACCEGVVRQSLARDLRFVAGIICIYWRRAGPGLLWEKPGSPSRVPWLTEGLTDLLITIMLLFFNCLQGMASMECGVCFC